ncbi:MAG: PorT family protein, partial [Bacteroidia bacterium]|nr:PorT family protein [Bacteroidia bacterium]
TVNPSEDFWGKLEPQLPETRKRRGLLWFSVVLLVTVSSFGIGYWFKSVSTQSDKPLAMQNSSVGTVNSGSSNSASVEAESPAPSVAKVATPTESSSEVKIDAKAEIKEEAISNKIKASLSSKPSRIKNSNQSLAEPISIEKAEQPTVAKSAEKELVQAERKSASTRRKSAKTKGTANQNKGVLASAPQEPIAPANTASSNVLTIQGKNEVSSLINDSSREFKAPISGPIEILSSKNVKPAAQDSFAENAPVRGNIYMEPEESFTSFSVTAIAGVHYGMMSLAKPESNLYDLGKAYDLRKSMEKPNIDFSGALWVDYHLNQSWMISVGVGITSFSQTLKFNVANANQPTSPKVQPENMYMHRSDSIITGSSNTYENRYSFTEIPIQISYHFRSDNNIQFSLGAGLSYARLNLVNVLMPDPTCIGLLNVTDKDAFPKFRDVFFASFNPSVSYKINSGVSIGFMPSFRMSLQNMVDNKDWIAQRPSMAGINIFLRKKF